MRLNIRRKRTLTAALVVTALSSSLDSSSALLANGRPLTTSPLFSSLSTTTRRSSSSSSSSKNDSIGMFETDLTRVLKDLRKDARDKDIPSPFNDASQLCFSHIWSLDDWEEHTSRWRYIDTLKLFPSSPLFKRLFPQMTVLVSWSVVATYLFSKNCNLLQKFTLPLTPLSLVSSFVAALLTLRSNQGLDRLNQGRIAFGKVVLHTRDMAQLIAAFVYPHDAYLGLKCLRHVSLVGWLLKHFLRGGPMDEDIVDAMLCRADAQFVLQQRKPPVAIVGRLRQVFHYMADRHELSTAAEIALDHTASALNECITTTERIVASPIPPLYTAHTGLLLTFYLACLPLALRGSGLLGAIGTVVTTTVVGYAMLGLDEISHLLEQPFKLMPLYQLSKNSMRDVGDAIVLQPPPLFGDNCDGVVADDSALSLKDAARPTYW